VDRARPDRHRSLAAARLQRGGSAAPGVADPRAEGVPLPLPDEVVRPRLVDRLTERWTHPLTVIQAGAGFGKSTLLAQAVRANLLEPNGIDVWHTCAPGDVDSDVLGRALLRALGVDARLREPAGQLTDTLAGFSPIDVCLVLDDAHEIRPGSSGAALIDRLVRRLPDNAHVVLAARHTLPAALSRLRAADRLVEIGEHDLLFTATETAAMAARLGRSPDAAVALGGWPALVRLALAVRPDVAIDYAQEEVLSQLRADQRRALFALANLGYADRPRVRRVVGADVDLAHLALTVPLVSRTDDGRFRAHDLWDAALERVLAADDVTELCRRVVEQLLVDGDLARGGALALAHDDLDALAAVALEAVRRHIAALPMDTVRPWVEALQRGRPDAPETRLLGAAFRHALDYTDGSPDADVDAAAAGFDARGDADGALVALVVATVHAYRRGDIARLREVTSRAAAVPGSRDQPVVDVALRAVAAIVAEMTGDLDRALAELEAAPLDRVPSTISSPVTHLLVHCLLLGGRAGDAVDVTGRLLAHRPDRTARYLSAIARWMAGDPAELLALGRSTVDIPAITSRDQFVLRTVVASMLASTGRRDEVHRLVESVVPPQPSPGNARDAVLDAVARSLCAVVDHDEPTAAGIIAEVVATHADSPILDQHLRRFLSLAYVLDPAVRDRWDGAPMGPTHEQARSTSRWLVDLRAGRPVGAGGLEPRQVFTTFPLPWAVELAARLHGERQPEGARLAEWLVDQVPDAARREMRHLASGGGAAARPAGELLARLPAVPSQRLEISVLGPLTVAFDGTPAAPSELRRARVRTLLALLVVHGTLSRERAIDLLWPEMSARDGARNLRVTLTYLRAALEPGRPTGEASFHLRADGSTITLHRSDYLVVDLWELRRLRRDADRSRSDGDPDRTVALLDAATGLWRGEPLTDLATVVDHEHEIEHIRVVQLDSLLEAGELRLVRGDATRAVIDAERALTLDPWSERAHRLAIAAALRGHDQPRTDVVTRRALTMLDELGVDPEPATQILLRQVAVVG
jgi:DNA-binding SARP family transcriptional activator